MGVMERCYARDSGPAIVNPQPYSPRRAEGKSSGHPWPKSNAQIIPEFIIFACLAIKNGNQGFGKPLLSCFQPVRNTGCLETGLSRPAGAVSSCAKDLSSGNKEASLYAKDLSSGDKEASLYAKDLPAGNKEASLYAKDLPAGNKEASLYAKDLSSGNKEASLYAKDLPSGDKEASLYAKDLPSGDKEASLYARTPPAGRGVFYLEFPKAGFPAK
jgi:hypothetical protein